MAKRNLAVLVGNGLSIAFNTDLILASITEELITRLQDDSINGEKIVKAMKGLAQRDVARGEVTDKDFEKLVGAFDSQSRTMDGLEELASLVDDKNEALLESIRDAKKFSTRIHDLGTSHVLEIITERSVGSVEEHAEIRGVIEDIIDNFDGNITFGNLNYDTPLMSALLGTKTYICDMSEGYGPVDLPIVDNSGGIRTEIAKYEAFRLRRRINFPEYARVRLIHMHGSLTYWHHVERDIHVKIPVEALRIHGLWSSLRSDEPESRPTVVLANERDKGQHVRRFPFDLAYEAFVSGLKDSDHWLIIGYSFRDYCVNDKLRTEFLSRTKKPKVLVSTFGDSPTREEVERALGWGAEDENSENWLKISRLGSRV